VLSSVRFDDSAVEYLALARRWGLCFLLGFLQCAAVEKCKAGRTRTCVLSTTSTVIDRC
jgi:hypothetical protein